MAMPSVPFSFLSILSWVFALWTAVCSAAPAAPPPAVDCSSLVLSMADCLSFVMAGSTVQKPEGSCCSGLKTVLKTDADCLCETFKNSAQLGVTLDIKKAFTLPAACHVSAPSVNNCGLTNDTAAAAPALSPSTLSPSSVTGAPTAAATSPSPTPPPASGSSAIKSSIAFLVLATVSYAATLSLF